MILDDLRFSRRVLRRIEDELTELASRSNDRHVIDRLRYLQHEVFSVRQLIEVDIHVATNAAPGKVNGQEDS